MDPRVTRTLAYYSRQDERLVGELPLAGLGLADLQRLFHQPLDDPMYDVYPVGGEQAPTLENALGRRLDLDRYDYFVECHAEPESAIVMNPDPSTGRAESGIGS